MISKGKSRLRGLRSGLRSGQRRLTLLWRIGSLGENLAFLPLMERGKLHTHWRVARELVVVEERSIKLNKLGAARIKTEKLLVVQPLVK